MLTATQSLYLPDEDDVEANDSSLFVTLSSRLISFSKLSLVTAAIVLLSVSGVLFTC